HGPQPALGDVLAGGLVGDGARVRITPRDGGGQLQLPVANPAVKVRGSRIPVAHAALHLRNVRALVVGVHDRDERTGVDFDRCTGVVNQAVRKGVRLARHQLFAVVGRVSLDGEPFT